MAKTSRKVADNSECRECKCLQTWNRGMRSESVACAFVPQWAFTALVTGVDTSCAEKQM